MVQLLALLVIVYVNGIAAFPHPPRPRRTFNNYQRDTFPSSPEQDDMDYLSEANISGIHNEWPGMHRSGDSCYIAKPGLDLDLRLAVNREAGRRAHETSSSTRSLDAGLLNHYQAQVQEVPMTKMRGEAEAGADIGLNLSLGRNSDMLGNWGLPPDHFSTEEDSSTYQPPAMDCISEAVYLEHQTLDAESSLSAFPAEERAILHAHHYHNQSVPMSIERMSHLKDVQRYLEDIDLAKRLRASLITVRGRREPWYADLPEEQRVPFYHLMAEIGKLQDRKSEFPNKRALLLSSTPQFREQVTRHWRAHGADAGFRALAQQFFNESLYIIAPGWFEGVRDEQFEPLNALLGEMLSYKEILELARQRKLTYKNVSQADREMALQIYRTEGRSAAFKELARKCANAIQMKRKNAKTRWTYAHNAMDVERLKRLSCLSGRKRTDAFLQKMGREGRERALEDETSREYALLTGKESLRSRNRRGSADISSPLLPPSPPSRYQQWAAGWNIRQGVAPLGPQIPTTDPPAFYRHSIFPPLSLNKQVGQASPH